jgi:hypothetical protein
LDNFRDKLASDGPGKTEAVRTARQQLEALVGQLAVNLEGTPGATDADLASTGFDLRKSPSHTSAELAAPGNLRLKHGTTTGEVQLLCDPVDRARMYEVQTALDADDNSWASAGQFSSTRGIVLKNLQRGKDVWARIRAIGGNGAGAWSDPATIMVV